MTGNHILKPLAVEHDHTLAHELKGGSLKRVVHSDVLALRPQQHEVLLRAVAFHAVDVMHHLAWLRLHQDPVQGDVGLPARHEVAVPVDTDRVLLCAPPIGVKRVAMQLPLLPVLRAESSRDGRPLTVGTLRLRRPTGQAPPAVTVFLVVLKAHFLRDAIAVAIFNLALFWHVSHSTRKFERHGNTDTKTKQFEQVGNAVPPLLASHVLAMATGNERLESAE